MPPKKLLDNRVEMFMTETDSGAWACYLDGALVSWGGGEMTAKELLNVLQGRGVRSMVTVDLGDYTPPDFHKTFAELNAAWDAHRAEKK